MHIVTVSVMDLIEVCKLVGYDKLENNQCGIAVKLKVTDDEYEKIQAYALASELCTESEAELSKLNLRKSAQE